MLQQGQIAIKMSEQSPFCCLPHLDQVQMVVDCQQFWAVFWSAPIKDLKTTDDFYMICAIHLAIPEWRESRGEKQKQKEKLISLHSL